MNLSPIATQIHILQEALEEQEKYSKKRPLDLKLDERCCSEMKKLQELIRGEKKGELNLKDLNQLYTVLVATEKSFELGLQRIMGKTFGSMLIDTHNGNPPWQVAETARDDIFKACLLEIVNQWAQIGTGEENRTEAKARILYFLANPHETELNLSELALKDLPDIFHGELTKRLILLNVSDNDLTTIPESIGNLTLLEELDISTNKITILPDWIGNLSSLKELEVAGCGLISLPETVRNLVALEYLDLGNNSCQPIPESIRYLTKLKKLNVSWNHLVALPEWMGDLVELENLIASYNSLQSIPETTKHLVKLKKLDVSWNELAALPDWIGNLSELDYLSLGANLLVALPESIGNLSKLKKLDLLDNALLASLPNTVLQLPSTCEVEIGEDYAFSLRFIDNLEAIVNAPGYSGPRFSFFIQDTDPYEVKTLEEALKDLSDVTDRQITFSGSLIDASQRNSLEMWLNRICEIADYKSSEGTKKQIANKVLDYLEETVRNEEFREIFYQVIADATRTCGDRVALSLLHIGLAYDESKIDLRDIQSLAQFLIRGVFVMSILEEIAREKIPTLRLVDEIEVYLGYPILLKERLQIPINIGKMLYARCSGLTEQDLGSAEMHVKEQIENKDTVYSFLVDQTKWLKALEAYFPEEIAKLKEERMAKLEEDQSQASKLNEKYKNSLIDMTKQLTLELL